MEQTQELLQKWDDRVLRLRPRMEIAGEGLTLGAGTVFAKMTRDGRGARRLTLDDEPRALALLATAFKRPVEACVVAKLRRACERWSEGEKALAHIHLAHAGLPPCGDEQALRLFVADELLEAGVTPETLMKAQGFDPAPPALLKFNPDQPRVPAGSGRESGEWTSGGAGGSDGIQGNVTSVSYRTRARMKALRTFLEWLRSRLKGPTHESPPEKAPPVHEEKKPAAEPPNPSPGALEVAPSRPKPSDFVGQDFGKLGVGIEKPDLNISRLSEHGEFRAETRGVSVDDLQSTVENPLLVLRQSSGRLFYLSDRAVVVLDSEGSVVTTYPASKFDTTIETILDQLYHRGAK